MTDAAKDMKNSTAPSTDQQGLIDGVPEEDGDEEMAEHDRDL